MLSQPVFVLTPLCSMLSEEATNTNFIVLTQPWIKTTIYGTRGEHVNYYIIDVVYSIVYQK